MPDNEEMRRYRVLARTDCSKAILEEIHRMEDRINALDVKLNGDDASRTIQDVTGSLLRRVDTIKWIVFATLILVIWKLV